MIRSLIGSCHSLELYECTVCIKWQDTVAVVAESDWGRWLCGPLEQTIKTSFL